VLKGTEHLAFDTRRVPKKFKRKEKKMSTMLLCEKNTLRWGVPSAGSLSTNPTNLLINPLQGPS
jgi:hypothetical protein